MNNSEKIKKYGEFYGDEKIEGEQKAFWQNGNLRLIGTIKSAKKDGLWKYYNEDGTLDVIETFKDGKKIN